MTKYVFNSHGSVQNKLYHVVMNYQKTCNMVKYIIIEILNDLYQD